MIFLYTILFIFIYFMYTCISLPIQVIYLREILFQYTHLLTIVLCTPHEANINIPNNIINTILFMRINLTVYYKQNNNVNTINLI